DQRALGGADCGHEVARELVQGCAFGAGVRQRGRICIRHDVPRSVRARPHAALVRLKDRAERGARISAEWLGEAWKNGEGSEAIPSAGVALIISEENFGRVQPGTWVKKSRANFSILLDSFA